MAEHATCNIGEFIDIGPDGVERFNFQKAKSAGKLHLIKRLRKNKHGDWEPEFHDAQAALALLGKFHNLFNDKGPQVESSGFPDFTDIGVRKAGAGSNGTANGHT